MYLIYVAGKYTDNHPYQIKKNIQRAEKLGMKIAKIGAVPLVPHLAMSHWEGLQDGQWFYDATLLMLSKCDAMIVVRKDSDDSSGTQTEIAFCVTNGIPWFWGDKEGIKEFKFWLKQQSQADIIV